jgi:signal transduction histidine kinase/ligand-binding sensor domain-containing protein
MVGDSPMFATPRIPLAALLLLLPFSVALRAGDVTPVANGDYSLTVWQSDDGLPHNSTTTIVQRRDGFIWIGTQGGLVRFDGLTFVPARSPLIDGIKSSSVASLIEEDEDTLLIATPQSGLVRLRHGEFSLHPLAAQFGPKDRVAQLYREADHVFWIIFNDRETWRWNNGAVQKFAAPPTVRNMQPTSVARDRNGNVYIVRGAGLEKFANGELRTIDQGPTSTVAITSASDGGIWVATGRRLSKYDGSRFIALGSPWQISMAPSCVFEDRHGALWVAAQEQGLIRWKDGVATPISTSHVKISALQDDDEGNLWVATSGGGLNRIQQTRLALVADEPNWTDTVSGTVCEDALGNLWFANRKGVRKITGGHVEVMNPDVGWPRRALPVAADRAGNVWLGVGSDVFRARADGTEPPKLVAAGNDGAVRAIFVARDGSVWAGRNAGPMAHFRPDGTSESFDATRGFTAKRVRCIGQDANGAIWVGTEEGLLFAQDKDRFVQPYADGKLPGHDLRAIYGDAAGNLWIATAGAGLLVVHNNQIATISIGQGLPDEVISQILEDDFGWLWFGSRRGIFKVQKRDLLDCAAGRTPTVTPTSFGRADGLSGISAVGSYQPTAWKTRSGELWFVTRKGLVKTNPARQESDRAMPRIYLEEFRADDRVIEGAKPHIQSSARKLEFRFTTPSYIAPERVRFRYRLKGFDTDWVDGGTQRFAKYPALPPGNYTFTVSASSGDLAWSPHGASLDFVVLPTWWETWWARLGAASVALAVLVVIVRYWSHRRLKARLAKLEQEQRLEQERVRIARNLHDDLGASLTHASMMAEELAEDWQDLPDPQGRSGELADRVRQIARDLDAVVWTVSPKNDSLASLASYLCHFAEEYFRHSPVECRAQVGDDIPALPLSPEVRHHLFMIAKELFNNVLKHSQAKHVEVNMQIVGEIFELVVADDGHGFSVREAAQSQRNGLKNLRARASEAGGVLHIESSRDGTVATLQFRTTKGGGPLLAPSPGERQNAAGGVESPLNSELQDSTPKS